MMRDVTVRDSEADDLQVMGPVSGWLWLTAAVVGAVCMIVGGSENPWIACAIIALTGAYGLACVTRAIPWERVSSLRPHVAAIVAAQPLIAAALWVSGGGDSYVAPLLVLPMLYVAYFFPPRFAWPLAALEIATFASPLLYDASRGLGARTLAYAAAFVGVTTVLQRLKRRLIAAERHQRDLAHRDALTGLANRRAFDIALERIVAAAGAPDQARRRGDAGGGFALLVIDVDDFKAINDTLGHQEGDRVLRELASGVSAVVRPGDCLARIGGDELALIAPGAGAAGAERLAGALTAAAAGVTTGMDAPLGLTIATAIFPADGVTPSALYRAADARLYEAKRSRSAIAVQ